MAALCDDNSDGDDDDDDVFISSHSSTLDPPPAASYISNPTPHNANYIYTPDAASQPSVCTAKTRVLSYRMSDGDRSTTCRRQPCLVVCIMVLHKSIFSGIMYRQHHTVYIES